jgi:hypothetical protein
MFRAVITVLIGATLSGCSTLAIPTPGFVAQRYDSVEEFIASNFDLDMLETQKRLEEGALYRAHFNGTNNTYLDKPITDLKTYCATKSGVLKQDNKPDLAFLQSLKRQLKSPLQAMFEAKTFSYAKGVSEDVAQAAAANAYSRQLKENSKNPNFDAELAISVINDKANEQYLGSFTCYSAAEIPLWKVVVEVESLTTGNIRKNGFDMPVAFIRIQGKTL